MTWEDIQSLLTPEMLQNLTKDRRIGAPRGPGAQGQFLEQEMRDVLNRYKTQSTPEPGLQAPAIDPIDFLGVPMAMGLGKLGMAGASRLGQQFAIPFGQKAAALRDIPGLAEAMNQAGNPLTNLLRSAGQRLQGLVPEMPGELVPAMAREGVSATSPKYNWGSWGARVIHDDPEKYATIISSRNPEVWEALAKEMPMEAGSEFRKLAAREIGGFYKPIGWWEGDKRRFAHELIGAQAGQNTNTEILPHEFLHQAGERLRGLSSYDIKPAADIQKDLDILSKYFPSGEMFVSFPGIKPWERAEFPIKGGLEQLYKAAGVPRNVSDFPAAGLAEKINKSPLYAELPSWRKGEELAAYMAENPQFYGQTAQDPLMQAMREVAARHVPPSLQGINWTGIGAYPALSNVSRAIYDYL